MTPPNDMTDVSLLFDYIKKHAAKILNHEQRLKMLEDRCEGHQPIIDKISDDEIRADERSKYRSVIWGYMATIGVIFGTVIAVIANGSKIIEVIVKLIN